ncbi:PI-PLC X domain-containing protein At5g67130-like isoform X1 [Amaranthus tricolor]|uniref:PI-PLC X domain-containing protein At5g67130-like isoform X1 n=1 Tax=Amaranthus tricolor TaxID=29722 RepID=UPI002587F279|nr:PI-PLC X domain-containing protein At5g67130-like isoform X1 [Amaranthus tricolor]
MGVHLLSVATLISFILHNSAVISAHCSNRQCKLLENCSENSDCGEGLYCSKCQYPKPSFSGATCVRSTVTNQFKLVNDSLPFNKYAFLTTHNSFAIRGEPHNIKAPRVTFTNQEDSITQQLHNGVRALMLDTYDYKGEIWLCHSLRKCHAYTAFERAIDTLKEIEAFMASNPSEIITLILEDYVKTPKGLTKIFEESGLVKYWFPASNMPKNGMNWPLVKQMVANNQRLVVFTSNKSKQESEGIAYQWDYMVENQYGNTGMEAGKCPKRKESSPMNDHTKSLVLVNHFKTIPVRLTACEHNSEELTQMLETCYAAAGNRWANFVAVDFYKRSAGGGAFQAVDTLNGELLCGCNDLHACLAKSSRWWRPCKKINRVLPSN